MEMGAEPGRRFLIQPAAKLEPVIVVFGFINNFQSMQKTKIRNIHQNVNQLQQLSQ